MAEVMDLVTSSHNQQRKEPAVCEEEECVLGIIKNYHKLHWTAGRE